MIETAQKIQMVTASHPNRKYIRSVCLQTDRKYYRCLSSFYAPGYKDAGAK